MKVKTSELIGAALDWAVAKCLNEDYLEKTVYDAVGGEYEASNYSENWGQGGPIIECERIIFDYHDTHPCDDNDKVHARLSYAKRKPSNASNWYAPRNGPTILIATMRCYIASKFGEYIDVPENLL